jgi:transcriptional regulator with XRE-family HTH domain
MNDAWIAVRRNDGLRRLRESSGRSQAQLAAELGYSTSHYAMVEREPRLLRSSLAARLAAALNIPLEQVLRAAIGECAADDNVEPKTSAETA